MQPVRQLAIRTSPGARPRNLPIRPYLPSHPVRLAHQSYGNEQSGMEQGTHLKNPKSHLEHPGPEAPAAKGSIDKKSSSSSSSSSAQPSGNQKSTSDDPGSAIHRPESAAEKTDPDVKKHNEEMEQRFDRSVNQLSEDDNKVDKNFWKGALSSRPLCHFDFEFTDIPLSRRRRPKKVVGSWLEHLLWNCVSFESLLVGIIFVP